MLEQLVKAFLVVEWHSGLLEFIEFQFNPTEITLDRSVKLAEIPIPGLDSPLIQFVRGESEKLTMDLFFDTTEEGMGLTATSVTTHTDRFYELTKIEPDGHAPPVCYFLWGDEFPGGQVSAAVGNQRRSDFKALVENVKQRFTLFSPTGIPLRATLTVTFREYKPLTQQLDELNLNSPDRTQVRALRGGETLSDVAGRHYRRGSAWRAIAEANGIDDPLRVKPGTFLDLPPLP